MLLNGEGTQVTASVTTAQWTPTASGGNSLSAYVVGDTNAVYLLVNCTTAEFDAAYAAGTCIRVQPATAFEFNGSTLVNIKSVCYRTAANTSDVDFAVF